MGRLNQSDRRRAAFRPILARAFVELGYRRATTAALAAACGVRENVLFRLWPDKKAMFLDAIDHVFQTSAVRWAAIAAGDDPQAAAKLLAFEAEHQGELGMYRIIFAGLTETDDADIRRALAQVFARFQAVIADHVSRHRKDGASTMTPAASAWGIIGVGLVSSVMRELQLLGEADRAVFFRAAGGLLLDG